MMIKVVRAIGHELVQVASTELTIGTYIFCFCKQCVLLIFILFIGNSVRRVLHLIREEHVNAMNNANNTNTNNTTNTQHNKMHNTHTTHNTHIISNILRVLTTDPVTELSIYDKSYPEMKSNLLLAIKEYLDEVCVYIMYI